MLSFLCGPCKHFSFWNHKMTSRLFLLHLFNPACMHTHNIMHGSGQHARVHSFILTCSWLLNSGSVASTHWAISTTHDICFLESLFTCNKMHGCCPPLVSWYVCIYVCLIVPQDQNILLSMSVKLNVLQRQCKCYQILFCFQRLKVSSGTLCIHFVNVTSFWELTLGFAK